MGDATLNRVTVAYTLTLATALHIGTGLGLAQILDDRTVQGPHPDDASLHLPYVPGSSVKGRLRAQVRRMLLALGGGEKERSRVEASLFGFPEQPGSLCFSDAHLDLEDARIAAWREHDMLHHLTTVERAFVGLSRVRRVALEQRLFRIELAEHGLPLHGQITGTLHGDTPEHDLGLLLAACLDLTHLGGMKGRGLGACTLRPDTITLDQTTLTLDALVRTALESLPA